MKRLSVFWCALLAAGGAGADWKAPREALDQRYVAGIYRIHYTVVGEHALPAERAGIYAAAVAEQLAGADAVYRETLGLRPPLEGKRYASARSIDIHIMRLEGKSGSTGDEPHVFRYRHFASGPPALTIALGNRWRPENLTPAHELFHAYQYGYTYFKNAWFLEGMARASENLFRGRPGYGPPLPRSGQELDDLLSRSYAADAFWNRLFALCGKHVVRQLLESYDRLDDDAARARGIDAAAWPEAQQRAAANDPYLLRGLRATMEGSCPVAESVEVREFLKLLAQTVR